MRWVLVVGLCLTLIAKNARAESPDLNLLKGESQASEASRWWPSAGFEKRLFRLFVGSFQRWVRQDANSRMNHRASFVQLVIDIP